MSLHKQKYHQPTLHSTVSLIPRGNLFSELATNISARTSPNKISHSHTICLIVYIVVLLKLNFSIIHINCLSCIFSMDIRFECWLILVNYFLQKYISETVNTYFLRPSNYLLHFFGLLLLQIQAYHLLCMQSFLFKSIPDC